MGEIYKFCGNRGKIQYVSLTYGGWMPLESTIIFLALCICSLINLKGSSLTCDVD